MDTLNQPQDHSVTAGAIIDRYAQRSDIVRKIDELNALIDQIKFDIKRVGSFLSKNADSALLDLLAEKQRKLKSLNQSLLLAENRKFMLECELQLTYANEADVTISRFLRRAIEFHRDSLLPAEERDRILYAALDGEKLF